MGPIFGPSVLNFTVLLLASYFISAAGFKNNEVIVEDVKGNITVRAGDELFLTCDLGHIITTGKYQCVWMFERNGQVATVVVNQSQWEDTMRCSLDLTNVTQVHSGWITCNAQSNEDINNASDADTYRSEPFFLHVVTEEIKFVAAPINRTFSIGNTADLECKTNVPVSSCQWSFQQEGQTEPLVVRVEPPLHDTDCSFELHGISYEQVGQWRCGVRIDINEDYTYTDMAYVQVEHKEEAFPIEFVDQPEDTEMHIGETGELSCKVCVEAHIEDCRWYWQPVGRSRAWSLLMREFLPINGNDCTLQFKEVTSDMEGLWSCHVKPIHSSTFEVSKSAIITIRAEVAVSVLSREVSVIEGEELVLNCLAEDIVGTCHWKRRDLYDAYSYDSITDPGIIYPPKDKQSRDCSLSIPHAKKEHQGLWNCGMKLAEDDPFQYTLPTAVSIKLPKRVKFIEGSRTKLAAENKPLILNCTALSAVEQCTWLWYEDQTKMSEGVVKFTSTHEPGVYDCSVNIPIVTRSLQGIWQCAVKYTFNNHTLTVYATPFSLTVVNPVDIKFLEVTPGVNGQPGPDGRVVLECVTWRPVEECLWLHQPNKNVEAKQVAKFEPEDFNNCSYLVEVGRSSGTWTCGARNPGDTNFTMARPTSVALVQQGSVVTKTSVSYASSIVVLQCQLLNISVLPVSCHWTHPSGYNVFEFYEIEKYVVESDPKLQTCSVRFDSMVFDIGEWKCTFSCNNQTHVLGQASITLLNAPENARLNLTVGVLSVVTVVLLIAVFVSLFCNLQRWINNNKTVQFQPPPENNRYTQDPTTGINFSFNEAPELLVDFTIPTQDSPCHHYERVGHCLPSRSSFYQNVS